MHVITLFKVAKNKKINVQGKEITIILDNGKEFISLTDMLKAKDGDFFISDWLRNRNTVEYLGIWESIYNPIFNYGEFAIIKSQAGLNSYKISVKDWVEKTNAIGLKATAGRYGGTYAHPDIALSNMESINALLIQQGVPQNERLMQLNKVAVTQMNSLVENKSVKKLK